MNQQSNNPYAPPVASVEDAREESPDGVLIPGGRSVPAGNGASWVGGGWALFKQAPGAWIGLLVVFFLISLVIAIIPLVNFLNSLISPVFTAGVMLAADNQRTRGELRIGDLFGGFERKFGPLFLLGVLAFGLVLLGLIPVLLIGGMGMISAMMSGVPAGSVMASMGIGMIIVMGLVFVAWVFLVYAAVWFAPALIILHDLPVFEAMKMSFKGCTRNALPGIIYSLVLLVLGIFATLPILLGWLVLAPVIWGSIYSSYRDIFIAD